MKGCKVMISSELPGEYLRTMLRIRYFEEEILKLQMNGELLGMAHPYIGEEAVAVGACSALTETDYIVSTHRGHGHCIGKGADIKKMMAELLTKETGYCRGRGGSMHIADVSIGHLGANGIVGAGLPIAVGAGLSIKYRDTDQVVICFFGDGAANQGTFHESLNMASIFKAPVVFVCENNLYAVSCRVTYSCAVPNIADRASAYNMPGVIVDGMDVLAVEDAVSQAVKRARKGEGPSLIECKTYRFLGHSITDNRPYRTRQEENEWKTKDPITSFRKKLVAEGIVSAKGIEKMEETVRLEIEEAVEFARQSPEPSVEDAEKYLFV